MDTETQSNGLRPLSRSQRRAVERAVAKYEAALEWEPGMLAYLEGRGIDSETAATFRLGVVEEPESGHERFKGMLAIPYLDKNGKALQVRFRCIEQHDHRSFHHGKYNTVTGDPVRMFNVKTIHRAVDVIHICEGELDAIILNANGFPAVALPGAQSWKARHRKMLAGFSDLYVWGDPDEAGAELVGKICRSLGNATALVLRDGDVTDTYLQGGKEALNKILAEGQAGVEEDE